MPIVFDNLKVKGALTNFHQALEAAPSVWQNHCQVIPSSTKTEALVFPGFQPAPRQFLNGRQFQGMLDFRYNVASLEYELSLLVPESDLEDDQTGLTMARMSELGEVWRTYKDSLFATLLSSGNVSGNNGWDGVTFHADTHASGSLGAANDNNLGYNAVATTTLLASEAIDVIADARTNFLGFNDDTGRPFNTQAATKVRFVGPPGFERGFWQAQNQTFVPAAGAVAAGSATITGGASNEFGPQFCDGFDVLPYLLAQGGAPTTEIYASALGSVRKPFIMLERTNLEIVMYSEQMEITRNRGLQVLCRQRFLETYGEPRRSLLYTIS